MVLSPCGNIILHGGSQERKYLNDGYIIVSNKLCAMNYENVKTMITENIKNNALQEIRLPYECKALYINAIHELVPFPYAKYLMTRSYVVSQFAKLKKRTPAYFKKDDSLVFKYVDSDYHLIKITNYFTEEQRMQCSIKTNPTPYALYKSKSFLRKMLSNLKTVSSFIMREAIWKYSTECNLFKSTLVVDICKKYKVKSYLDISAGWGDRLIGALAAGVDKYVGYDPNTKLQKGHRQIQKLFDKKKVSKIYYEPFQTANIPVDTFDLVLSSPPYFDFENYSSMKTQSDKTFVSIDSWLNGFLLVSLNKAWAGLKVGGHMIIHIDDITGCNIVKPMTDHFKTLNGSSKVSIMYVDGHKKKLRRMFHIQKLK